MGVFLHKIHVRPFSAKSFSERPFSEKYLYHSKSIRPVSSYATLGGGRPIRTALRRAIHLAYTARRFKCTN